jgi:hypothetical protein
MVMSPDGTRNRAALCWQGPAAIYYSAQEQFFNPEDVGDIHLLAFNGIHGVISRKTNLFITTAVTTSNPTCSNFK